MLAASAFASGAWAQALPAPELSAKAWLLLDETSGQVIASHAATARIEPASLTKIMTAYIVFGALQDGTLKPEQKVRVSTRAWKVPAGSSKMFLEPGSLVTVDNLLRGLMVQSGNDAAVALAEAVSGSVEAFVERMNRDRRGAGAARHAFRQSARPVRSGHVLHRQRSVGAGHAFIRDYPELYRTYDSAKQFTYNNITQSNRNRLLWLDPSVDGLKTGHTDAAGYCLVATARRPNGADQRRLITVVVGVESENSAPGKPRVAGMGLPGVQYRQALRQGPARGHARSLERPGRQPEGRLRARSVCDRAGRRQGRTGVAPREPLVAPIAAQAEVGELRVMVDGKPARQFPVLALEPVEQAGFAGRAWIRSACGGVKPRAEQRRPA